MKTNEMFFFGGLIVAAFVACALADDRPGHKEQAQSGISQSDRPAGGAPKVKATPDFPVIGYLEKRGQTITIKAGPKGPLYSAKTTDGKTLFENLSGDQLRAQAPELHEFLKTAIAGGPGKSGVVADARLR